MLAINRTILTVFVGIVACFNLQAQENWPRFRGPNGTGLIESAQLPAQISAANYLWQTNLAGSGCSSPVIWDDRLFVTSCDAKTSELTLQCFNASTGQLEWQRSFPSTPYHVHSRNSFASATPAVDADRVYVSYANPEHTMLVALDHAGEKLWERDFGTWISQHGFAVSPMVYKDKVIFYNSQQAEKVKPDQTPGRSRVIAVDAQSGADAWTTELTATRTCYAVPSVFTGADGKDQIVSCNTGDGFFSLDPETGSRNWATLPFRMRTVAATLVADGLVIGSNGSGGGGNYLVAIRPDQDSTHNPPQQVYQLQKANYVPSPVAVDGKLFFFTDKGIGNCVDLKTGDVHWQKRISSGFSGSPVANQQQIYIMDEDGKVFVIAASDEFKLISKHDLGQPSRATPAIWDNKIYFRTESKLFCVGTAESSTE